MEEKLQAHQVDIDPDFEPQSRPRSCTWPLPHPDFAEDDDGGSAGAPPALAPGPADGPEHGGGIPGERRAPAAAAPPPPGADVGQLRKAKTSRRNAWGNLSYADLITKAIESAPEKRLTLSQIYDWMVRYVPYFKDKGDSNSSAGWKVTEPPGRALGVGERDTGVRPAGTVAPLEGTVPGAPRCPPPSPSSPEGTETAGTPPVPPVLMVPGVRSRFLLSPAASAGIGAWWARGLRHRRNQPRPVSVTRLGHGGYGVTLLGANGALLGRGS